MGQRNQTGAALKAFSFLTSFQSSGRCYTWCCSWEKTSVVSPTSEQQIIQYQTSRQDVITGSLVSWRLLGQRIFWLDLSLTHRIYACYYKSEQKPVAQEVKGPRGSTNTVVLLNEHVDRLPSIYSCLYS